jgi:hypothetical protein
MFNNFEQVNYVFAGYNSLLPRCNPDVNENNIFFQTLRILVFLYFLCNSIHELFPEEQFICNRMREVTLLEKKGICRSYSYQLTDKPDTHSERHVFFWVSRYRMIQNPNVFLLNACSFHKYTANKCQLPNFTFQWPKDQAQVLSRAID